MTSTDDANVVLLLDRVAARCPDRTALALEGEPPLSFAGLRKRVGRVAGGLERLGLGAGDRSIVMIPMSTDLYAGLLGILQMGGIAVFVDPWVGRRRMADMAALAEPRAFLGTARSHLLRLADRRLRAIPLAATSGRRIGPLPAPHTLAEIEAGDARPDIAPATSSDTALVTLTTGSSGAPKGADRTHGFLVAQHRALEEEFPSADDDVDMPMFPVFALDNLARGIPSVVPAMDFRRVGAVDPARILRQMETHGVTTATASPPFFDRLSDHLKQGATPPRLRRILTGGAPVSDRQLERWLESFPGTEIVVVYGSTEAEPVAHIGAQERLGLRASETSERPGGFCVGRLSPRVEGKLIRIEQGPVDLGATGWAGWEVAPGEVGELVVTGEHVCRSYFRSPEATRENKIAGPDGRIWHRMGDTGRFDAEGRFWLVGRVHSTIFRSGAPVHAQLVEQAAVRVPEVGRAAAVGVADPRLGERVVLVLETGEGSGGSPSIRRAVAAALERSGQPVDEIRFADRPLPLDPRHASKVDYRTLRARLEAR